MVIIWVSRRWKKPWTSMDLKEFVFVSTVRLQAVELGHKKPSEIKSILLTGTLITGTGSFITTCLN